ncbi:MAG: serine hydrolase [Chloroflexi bacterium]|nr:serine hydrolase [Chloroflexota bacterium]
MKKITPQAISDIEAYIDQTLQTWGIPGGASLILKDGQLLSNRGYGVRELGKPEKMDADTIFHIASSTKAFTAACLGLLVDEGKLSWDDPVVKYLPEFKVYDPWITQEVSVRDLLNHKLGLKRYNHIMFRNIPFDPDEFLQHVPFMKPFTPFRTRFVYGNEQYVIAGKLIEVISGKPYDVFLQERIFDPLGMTSTFPSLAHLERSGRTNICHGHCNLDGGFVPVGVRLQDPVQSLPLVDIGLNAAGGIWSTLSDLARWLEFFLGNGTFQGKTLASPQVMAELQTPQFAIAPEDEELNTIFSAVGVEINIMTYAFGWYVMDYQGRKLVVHGGNIHNGNNIIGFLPGENVAFLIFVNTYQVIAHALMSFYLLDALFEKPVDYSARGLEAAGMWQAGATQAIEGLVSSKKLDTHPSQPLERYAGKYASPLMGELQLALKDGKLHFTYGNSHMFDAALQHWQDDTFVVDFVNKYQDPEFVAFQVDEDGSVSSLVWLDPEFNEIDAMGHLQ